jgi:molybdopterin/thiamine biosynthesis adenylyltransferase
MAHVLVVGAGGNIGSHLVPHLGRMPGVSRVTCIDRDRYEEANLSTQNILPRDIGKPKAVVQAAHLKTIAPSLSVSALHDAVENIPLGLFRADVIVACLDSRRARLTVNEAAFRLGVPWLDAGVHGDGCLARIQFFIPVGGMPCLECAWDSADYAAVEQEYPCGAGALAGPASSAASSSLGALAASLQALECARWIAGDREHALGGRELLIDAKHRKQFVTVSRRNQRCRMPDHEPWSIAPSGLVAESADVGTLLDLGSHAIAESGSVDVAIAGQRLVALLTCPSCGRSRSTFHLDRGLRDAGPRCWRCRRRLEAAPFDVSDTAPVRSLPASVRAMRLVDVGLHAGDVASFTSGHAAAHFEIGGRRA